MLEKNSFFNMWRLVVSAVHADQNIHEKEEEMIKDYILSLDALDENQKKQLTEELSHSVSADKILPLITEPAHRSQAIYFCRLLLWKDDVMMDIEKEFLYKVISHFQPLIKFEELKPRLSEAEKVVEQQPDIIFPDSKLLNFFLFISDKIRVKRSA